MKIKDWFLLEKQDLDRRIRSYPRFRALLLSATILSFFVSVLWLWQKTFSLEVETYDQAMMSFINQIKSPFLDSFFSGLTLLGTGYFIAISCLILIIFLVKKRRKRAAFVSLITLVGSASFIAFFKIFFGRQRPGICINEFGGYGCLSFPSGHATISFYFYGLLDYFIFRFLPISLKKFVVISLLIGILIFLTAFSRVYLGLHYPSDLLAGFFLGGSWLLLAILLIDFLY